MSRTASRLLALLSLLQSSPRWTGTELAERLEVTTRTVRNDIDRLRELGYAVEADRGGVGGYRLGAGGTAVPPLLLDDDETVAVAVGLRTGVNCIVGGMEETSLRALAKLEQILPQRMRRRVNDLNRFTIPLPHIRPVPIVDPALLTSLVSSCAERRRVRFHYEGAGCEVEPYRMVNRQHRWYLLGYDVRAEQWCVHDAAAIRLRTPEGPRFAPRELPASDLEEYVARRVPGPVWRHHAHAVVSAPAAEVRAELVPSEALVEPRDDGSCDVWLGAESFRAIALALGRTGHDFTVTEPPELVDEMTRLARRFESASGAVTVS